jgi:hypothetical protein
MALNFPDSPTLNQVYTDTTSGFSYQWDGVVWKSYAAASAKNIKIIDDISGSFNGSTNSFPITIDGASFTPANAQQLRIVLGGIIQQPLADYVVSGANIAFTTPPNSGLTFSGVSLGPALPAVGVGSTGTFYTRQSYTVSGTQSSFTVTAGYDLGYLDVYHNGVRLLVGVDYTASDGSGFTLTSAAQNGDIVEVISYKTAAYYTLNGVLNDLIVSGNASIGGNTYISGITTVVGSLNVIGASNFNTAGIVTASNLNITNTALLGGNKVKVGVGTTSLIVEGDARITGILTIGTSSITLDGTSNEVRVGNGMTISSTSINMTGMTISSTGINMSGSSLISGVGIQSGGVAVGYGITTLNFVGTGNTFAINGNRVDISISGGGGAASQWITTAAGIHTLSNVGIGTTNPTSKLEVAGVIKDSNGNVRAIPNIGVTTSYTLTVNDIGELINITVGGVTVPQNVFSAGNAVSIYNNSALSQTITQGTGVTLRLAGTATTGNRTLAQRGLTTVMCVASNEFVISGAGLS